MAKWRAIKPAFRNAARVHPNEELETHLDPGKAFVPIDDDAVSVRADTLRKEEEKAAAAKPVEVTHVVEAPKTDPKDVPIPANWLDMRREQQVNLARRLGASGKCNSTQAIAHIEKTLRERNGEVDEPVSVPVSGPQGPFNPAPVPIPSVVNPHPGEDDGEDADGDRPNADERKSDEPKRADAPAEKPAAKQPERPHGKEPEKPLGKRHT